MPGETLALDPRLFALVVTAGIGVVLLAASLRPAWIVRRPVAVLTVVAALSLASSLLLFRLDPPRLALSIDASTEPLLPAGDPAQELYRAAVLDFGDDEIFVVAIECGEVFTVPCLTAMDRASTRIAHLPGVRSVKSLLDVTSFRYVAEEDWIEVRPFIEDIPTDPAELADLRRRALADPVYRRSLVSDDARAAAINVSFRKMTDKEFIDQDLDGRIAVIVEEEIGGDGFRFYLAGRPHLKTRVYHGMLDDLRTLIPLSIAVVGVVLWIVTGAVRGVVIPISVALLANLWTFAAIALLEFPLTLLTGLLAPTLLAIGSIYGVHVLSRYEEEATSHDDPSAAVLASQRHLTMPVSIAGLTTIAGFGALLITDVPAVFEVGAFSMLGIAAITLLSLTFVPALLVLLPLRPRYGHRLDRHLDRLLDALAVGVQRHTGWMIGGSLVAVAIAVLAIPRIVIDTDYLSYLDEADPVRVDFEAVNRLLAGVIPIYVVLKGNGPGAFREPELLRAVETLQARMDELAGVSRTLTFLETVRVLNRAFHSDDPDEERIPATRPGVTELLFMIPKSELQRFTTIDHAKANLIVRTGEVGSAAIQRLSVALERAIAENPLPQGALARVTGNAILLSRSADGIARGQPQTVGIAVVTIFLLITVGLASVRLGAVAMIPNVVPVVIFFGLLGLGVAPLSLPTSLIGSVALGIAIDDTVHFLARYRAERRVGASPEEAALRCGRFVGRPIFITSVMLFFGFLVIAFSEFATLQEFGILSATTMAICLVTDLVLLPAILVRLRI
ncbi:MAG: MMPL family transporter [Proteobacteria bacterium]|nr:MMPL family transporter [Pseudomonadota bacterium]